MRGLIGGLCGSASLVLSLMLACSSPAAAQSYITPATAAALPAESGSPLANPMFAAPAVPAGMVNLQDNVASPYLSPDRQIHGYLSTGVSTNGGRGVEGGAIIPIVPGTASLEVGGGTGQFGVRLPVVTAQGIGTKKATVSSDNYYATLHLHPTADVDMDISVSSDTLRLRGPGVAAQRLVVGP